MAGRRQWPSSIRKTKPGADDDLSVHVPAFVDWFADSTACGPVCCRSIWQARGRSARAFTSAVTLQTTGAMVQLGFWSFNRGKPSALRRGWRRCSNAKVPGGLNCRLSHRAGAVSGGRSVRGLPCTAAAPCVIQDPNVLHRRRLRALPSHCCPCRRTRSTSSGIRSISRTRNTSKPAIPELLRLRRPQQDVSAILNHLHLRCRHQITREARLPRNR